MIRLLLFSTFLLSSDAFGSTPLEDAERLVFEWLSGEPPSDVPEFFSDISRLTKSAQKNADATERLQLTKDKLQYYRAKLEAEEVLQDKLWAVAEDLAERKQDALNAEQTYRLELESVSRKWGGDHWWLLMDLLAEYVSASRPLPD